MSKADLSYLQAQYCRSDIGIARRVQDIVEGLINGIRYKIQITSHVSEITFDFMDECIHNQPYFSTKNYEMVWNEKSNTLTIKNAKISFDVYF